VPCRCFVNALREYRARFVCCKIWWNMHPETDKVSGSSAKESGGPNPWPRWYLALALFWLAFVGLLAFLTRLGS